MEIQEQNSMPRQRNQIPSNDLDSLEFPACKIIQDPDIQQ